MESVVTSDQDKYKVLIAEDDSLIAQIVEERLLDAGFIVCGIATTVREGIALADAHAPDLAVVDVRLAQNDLGTTLADILKQGGKTGVLFATASSEMIEGSPGHAIIPKPYSLDMLCDTLLVLGRYMRTGVLEKPFPPKVKTLFAL